MAALAACMMGLFVPQVSAQRPTSVRTPRPPVCAGECPEDLQRAFAQAREDLLRLATMLAERGESLDAAEMASVRQQLTRAVRTMERLELQAREHQVQRVIVRPAPTPSPVIAREGWLGVSFSANFEVTERPGQPRLFRFQAYPVVESVEPASPAREAGIEVGDVLLAFKEKDLRKHPIALDELLAPGTRLPVLLRREGRTRTVTVRVGERPGGSYTYLGVVAAPTPAPPARVSGEPSVAPVSPTPPLPNIWVGASEMPPLAGAQMARVPIQLREPLGVSGGLLVLRVPHGTPAARAGLQEGDVIVRADGEPVRSSGDLQVAIRRANARSLRLEVVRDREAMKVTMRW